MEFDALLEQRRSIRRYQAQPVGKEQIEQMIEAAIQAPTWKNSQTGRYHVVMSQPLLDQLKEQGLARFNAENTHDAPVLIVTTFVKDRSGFEKNGQPSNELGNGWGAYDLGLHDANLILKARELGLDTLIMGIRDADALRESWGLMGTRKWCRSLPWDTGTSTLPCRPGRAWRRLPVFIRMDGG